MSSWRQRGAAVLLAVLCATDGYAGAQHQVMATMPQNGSELMERVETLESQTDALNSKLAMLDSRLDGVIIRLDQIDARPRDCSDLPAGTPSGVHYIWPNLSSIQTPVRTLCDMETDGGGWTVFQRRDNIQPRLNFFLESTHYKLGFGDPVGEFWLGLNSLWQLTSVQDRQYELRIDLEAFDSFLGVTWHSLVTRASGSCLRLRASR